MARQHKLFQIFRAGRHTTSSGHVVEFTEADLEKTVAVYSPKLSEAPLVLGHPKDDLPSFGEVNGMITKGGVLYAQADVSSTLVDLVRAGRYHNISASFHHPKHPDNPTPGAYYLKHVGFLGAMPPAVRGLTPPSFSEPSAALCFSEGHALQASNRRPGSAWEQRLDLEHDRMAMHNLACEYQDVCPELTYAEAIQHVRGVLAF
ncbi:hypothetical protein [Pseudomonas chlororaphis]|uniref:hypothetical protein n=1 Tax=Pseudomonas chlororaphis TaxID=587753 RepID=UPI00131A5690|nr:hypothetical protein [Pseudomonas chlororaphis]